MKLKFTLLSAFIVMCFVVKAQQIPNNSFETWTNPANPDGFSDWESASQGIIPNHFTFKDTSHAFGSFSVQVKTDTATILVPPAVKLAGIVAVGNATINLSGQFVMGGIPFAIRPDTLFFTSKYKSPATDTGILSITLTKAGSAILQQTLLMPEDTAWGGYLYVLTNHYTNNNNPDTLRLYFTSSFRAGVVGSALNVDGVGFGYVDHTGIDNISAKIGLKVYPNPASSFLNISANTDMKGYKIGIYNLFGQLVSNEVLDGSSNTIDITGFACGTYVYQILDTKNNLVIQSKVSVVK